MMSLDLIIINMTPLLMLGSSKLKPHADIGFRHPRRAKKRALVRYHPDRQHGATLKVQVEAEEIFKIVSEAPLLCPVPRFTGRRP